jgi:glycosyltransferase involved in cell wall biosynthesis
MMKPKVINLISFINRSLVWEWMIDYFAKSNSFEYCFIVLNPGDSELIKYAKQRGVKIWYIKYRGKRDFISALLKVIKIFISQKPFIINTNLIDSSIIGHLAGWITGIKVRINTRHHSSYHHDYFPHGIKYDKLVNKLSTHIITASSIVKIFLIEKENVPAEKIYVINFGFDVYQFSHVDIDNVKHLQGKYLGSNMTAYPVIGVVSRFIEWKGIQYIIPAFKQIRAEFPKAHLILANANGSYESEIKRLLSDIPSSHYTIIAFEMDITSLYKLFDIFVHVPIDPISEAFGQVYIEALAAQIPSVFTLSGIAHDFIQDNYNAVVVDYKTSEGIYYAIKQLLVNEHLRNQIKVNGITSVLKRYSKQKMLNEWQIFYDKLLNI